jgi:hypothetical protein
MTGKLRRSWLALCVVAVAGAGLLGITTAAASTPGAAVIVEPQGGAGAPTPGSGMGTKAALDNPKCTVDDATGPYGRFDGAALADGAVCVKPWSSSDDNGGNTSTGVTADKVTVAVILPATPVMATNRATGTATGTHQDAAFDEAQALMQLYETWGRAIEFEFFESTGPDEEAQRADAVQILAAKPFAALNFDTMGLDVLEAELAKGKVMTFGYATSPNEAEALAPYRWGGNDPQAAMINSAEVIGKQLVGKKAEWAGSDELKGQTRKFGVVSIASIFDIPLFKEELAEYKGTVASESTYPASGSTFGDPTVSAAQAPSIVGKMKQAGVTTVVLLTDVAMNASMMEEAVKQDWFPEWFITGTGYYDYQPFTSALPPEQVSHMFGIALLTPYLQPGSDPVVAGLTNYVAPMNWYWGPTAATVTPTITAGLTWLFNGLHTAGPKLTPKTFRQGLFSMPPRDGSAANSPLTSMTAYGEATGLPYDGYFASQIDFAPEWIDPDTAGPLPVAGGTPDKPAQMFVDGGRRYSSGTWPTKKIPYFDKDKAITSFTSQPAGVPVGTPAPCTGCPSSGNTTIKPGAPDNTSFMIAYPTTATSTR